MDNTEFWRKEVSQKAYIPKNNGNRVGNVR
jgi:hypothetical protein